MPSEFMLDLCFIRPATENPDFFLEIETEIRALFQDSGTWYVDGKTADGLDIATVEINGLSHWETEDNVIAYVETRMTSECWNWLQGYKLRVVPKEDVGPCERKR